MANSIKVNGHKITIISENENELVARVSRYKVAISKAPYEMSIDETRYISIDGEECYVGMTIKDGVAESTKAEFEEGVDSGLRFRMTFPTLREMFTDADKLKTAFYYAEELDEDPFENPKTWNLYYLFEGFFFSGYHSKTKVDRGNGKFVSFKW